jgi:hypothetical protein
VQIKSLQALFDPRTLHEKCCSDKSGKSAQNSSKMPLRKRKLPPSFFKEPRNQFQDNFPSSHIILQNNEYPLSLNEVTESGTHLPNDTIESILGQTDFHDLLIGSWSDGNSSANSSAFSTYDGNSANFSPESYSDSSDGSCSVSPKIQHLNMCDITQSTSDYVPAIPPYEPVYSDSGLTPDCFINKQNTTDQIAPNCSSSGFVNVIPPTTEGFLPLLNEPLDKYDYLCNDSILDTNADMQVPSGVLPAFPQAFYGQNNITQDTGNNCNNDSLLVTDFYCWEQTSSQLKPCYTYL